jgi:hypothetical protein
MKKNLTAQLQTEFDQTRGIKGGVRGEVRPLGQRSRARRATMDSISQKSLIEESETVAGARKQTGRKESRERLALPSRG